MDEKYWKQFENSGRIEDYLSFVNSTGRDMPDGQVREDSHAGIYHSDRNCIETDPGRGI